MSNVQTAPQTSSAYAADPAHAATSRTRKLTAAQSDYLYPWVRPYYGEPLALSRGEGVWLTDVDGDEYLDLFAGILTTSVGHCNPAVVEAARAQMERLGHTSALYVTEGQIEAARALAEIAPGARSPRPARTRPPPHRRCGSIRSRRASRPPS